jgi:hypothetical protein
MGHSSSSVAYNRSARQDISPLYDPADSLSRLQEATTEPDLPIITP